MDTSLSGRHALVCGASAGIGRAAARALAALGCRITALSRNEERLREVVAEVLDHGAEEARYIVADLDNRAVALEKVQHLLADHGPVHILINNTGGPPPGPILEATESDFEYAFGRHLLANHGLTRLVLPGMRAAKYGRIINVVSASVREPIVGLGVSNTTRGAVASWAKSVSNELPPGVTINNVLPGSIDTERLRALASQFAEQRATTSEDIFEQWRKAIPEGRIGEPSEIGEVIAFLATPAAGYVRGQSLAVDGGRMRAL